MAFCSLLGSVFRYAMNASTAIWFGLPSLQLSSSRAFPSVLSSLMVCGHTPRLSFLCCARRAWSPFPRKRILNDRSNIGSGEHLPTQWISHDPFATFDRSCQLVHFPRIAIFTRLEVAPWNVRHWIKRNHSLGIDVLSLQQLMIRVHHRRVRQSRQRTWQQSFKSLYALDKRFADFVLFIVVSSCLVAGIRAVSATFKIS